MVKRNLERYDLPVVADAFENEFMHLAGEPIYLSEFVANSQYVREWLKGEQSDSVALLQYLRSLVREKDIESLHIISGSSLHLYSSRWPGRIVNPSTDPFYWRFLRQTQDRQFNIDIDKVYQSDNLYFYVNNKIFDEKGLYLGMANISVPFQRMQLFVDKGALKNKGAIYIVDGQGRIKLHQDRTLISTPINTINEGDITQREGIAQVARAILSEKNQLLSYDTEDDQVWVISRFIPEFGWYLVIELSQKQVLAPYFRLLWNNLAFSGVAALLTALLSILIVNQLLINPLIRFKDTLLAFFSFLKRERASLPAMNKEGSSEISQMAREVANEVERITQQLQQDKEVIQELYLLISHINEGRLTHRLQKQSANPEMQLLVQEVNGMMQILEHKVGSDLYEIIEVLKSYASMEFRYPFIRSSGELEQQVHEMGKQIQQYVEEIQSQNDKLSENQEKLNQQKHDIEEKNRALEEVNQRMQEMNLDLESVVEKRSRELSIAYQELDTFLYRSSHDLRRPLTTLSGLIQLGQMYTKDERVTEMLSYIMRVVNGMDYMLRKLIKVSEINSAGGETTLLEANSLYTMVQEVFQQFQENLEMHHIETRVEIDPSLRIITQESLLREILHNLIENAIHYHGNSHPFVSVRLKTTEMGISLEVEDNGRGISPDIEGRIYQMYFKGNELSTGNGLGLYLVKKICDKLQATIRYESVLHEFTRFIVLIPTGRYSTPKSNESL